MKLPSELDVFCDKFIKDHKNIRLYARDRKGRPVGMLLAYKDGDSIKIGWSKCKVKEDVFRKDFTLFLAAVRAEKKSLSLDGRTHGRSIPHCIEKLLPLFLNRVHKYFKLGKGNKIKQANN